MLSYLIPLLGGIFMGAVFMVGLPMQRPHVVQQRYPHWPSSLSYLLGAFVGGTIFATIWIIGWTYMLRERPVIDGVLTGVGWFLGAVLVGFIKLRRMRRT